MSNSQIRAKAREALGKNIFGNRWMFSLLACILIDLILAASNILPAIGAILLLGPISVGQAAYFIRLNRSEEKPQIEGIFAGFTGGGIGDNILLGLMIGIFTFLWSLLLIIPGIIKSFSYSMAYYIKNDNPDMDWNTCITESRKMMKGKKWKLFCLYLSFIGWFIVGMITFGIGMFWVIPYVNASTAAFYDDIKG